ncbi:hypothetical protein [Nocardia sp. NPDC051832]|uniref:hypothetical protein n=1 Tax=Nocardia sp. NPDC051832 TaxID=3155673 RepID=UPI003425B85E
MTQISSMLSAGVWPLVLLVGGVVVVTLVALCRAEVNDVPKVFASFADAFGIHRHTPDPSRDCELGTLPAPLDAACEHDEGGQDLREEDE